MHLNNYCFFAQQECIGKPFTIGSFIKSNVGRSTWLGEVGKNDKVKEDISLKTC
jgi:hypothetical protein